MSEATRRQQSAYERLGGDNGVRALVETFYDIIEQEEYAADLHLLHRRGFGVAHSREEQFNYLSGFLGGPQRYVMKHGHARLKEIHEHVPIGPEMRDLWLRCMAEAMDRLGLDGELSSLLTRHFKAAAETSRNMD
ncbi:group II truncated hemoglobin [Mesorhizobium sp. VNQ89]|uniref:group II truncated hemoglobin n=1 Tax=Mesorhizobium quangtriensis TaxID=3157709 RepID=UPI0032B86717